MEGLRRGLPRLDARRVRLLPARHGRPARRRDLRTGEDLVGRRTPSPSRSRCAPSARCSSGSSRTAAAAGRRSWAASSSTPSWSCSRRSRRRSASFLVAAGGLRDRDGRRLGRRRLAGDGVGAREDPRPPVGHPPGGLSRGLPPGRPHLRARLPPFRLARHVRRRVAARLPRRVHQDGRQGVARSGPRTARGGARRRLRGRTACGRRCAPAGRSSSTWSRSWRRSTHSATGPRTCTPAPSWRSSAASPLETVAKMTILYNLAAITGGILFGALSQRIGRRRAIATSALLAIPMIPLWIGSSSVAGLAVGAVPHAVRRPGRMGGGAGPPERAFAHGRPRDLPGPRLPAREPRRRLRAARLQAVVAERRGGDYSFSLGWVVGIGAVVLAVIALAGPEARDADLAPGSPEGLIPRHGLHPGGPPRARFRPADRLPGAAQRRAVRRRDGRGRARSSSSPAPARERPARSPTAWPGSYRRACGPGEILLLTFTNKAAKQMLHRVHELTGIEPRRFWGGTFHSIGHRALRILRRGDRARQGLHDPGRRGGGAPAQAGRRGR